MTQEDSLITPEMRATIGVERPPRFLEVDRTSIRMFARAVGHTNLIYYDVEAARKRGFKDLVAPPGFLGKRIFLSTDDLDLFPELSWPHLPHGLNGGQAYEYFETILAGDILEDRTRIVGIAQRRSSLGPIVITTSESVYRRVVDGTKVAIVRGTGLSY